MPETTKKEMARKAGYLWVISCSNRDLLYKDLIEEFLSDESIAYCVDSGFIKPVDEMAKEHIVMWTMNPNNKIFFDNNLYKERFCYGYSVNLKKVINLDITDANRQN